MVSDDIDISDTSNSANFSCRQNISEGCSAVGCSLIASGAMRPSRTARVFSFSESAMLSSNWPAGPPPRDGPRGGGFIGIFSHRGPPELSLSASFDLDVGVADDAIPFADVGTDVVGKLRG